MLLGCLYYLRMFLNNSTYSTQSSALFKIVIYQVLGEGPGYFFKHILENKDLSPSLDTPV